MTNTVRRVIHDTRKVFSTKWSPRNLHVPAWVVNAIIYITVIRSLVYGLELLYIGNIAGANSLLGFVAIMGLPTWGILMIGAVAVLMLGLVLRNSIIVTFGALLCAAVWVSFGLILCIGWAEVGTGGRFAVAALSTAATWVLFFYLQLKTLRTNGVET